MASNKGAGIGLLGFMFLGMFFMKLGGVVTFSWWWVTAPLWGVFVLFIVVWTLVLAGAFTIDVVRYVSGRSKRKRLREEKEELDRLRNDFQG